MTTAMSGENSSTAEFIRFGRATSGTLEEAERREWWLGNGRGGYSAGTIAQTLTRRYHGLLVAPITPPLGRHCPFQRFDRPGKLPLLVQLDSGRVVVRKQGEQDQQGLEHALSINGSPATGIHIS